VWGAGGMKEKKSAVGEGTGEAKVEFSLIPHATLLALYDGLVKASDRRGTAKAAAGDAHAWKYVAAAVAVGQDLLSGDTVIAERAVPVLRQAKVAARGFAAELERAMGVALRDKTKKTGKATVVFTAGASGEQWLDALEVARAHRLPMVFVTELREEKTATRKTGLEPGTELPRVVVDGHDVVASYRVAHEAIDRARRDRGPTLMECTAFRLKGRRQQDSVAMMKSYLRAKGMLT
jgi:TPP-dependent pyruvate/acetoin dehydrogenase alpha subunit